MHSCSELRKQWEAAEARLEFWIERYHAANTDKALAEAEKMVKTCNAIAESLNRKLVSVERHTRAAA